MWCASQRVILADTVSASQSCSELSPHLQREHYVAGIGHPAEPPACHRSISVSHHHVRWLGRVRRIREDPGLFPLPPAFTVNSICLPSGRISVWDRYKCPWTQRGREHTVWGRGEWRTDPHIVAAVVARIEECHRLVIRRDTGHSVEGILGTTISGSPPTVATEKIASGGDPLSAATASHREPRQAGRRPPRRA